MVGQQNLSLTHRSAATDGVIQLRRPLRVALVNMPWARADTPSIQCGLLQEVVKRCGGDARSFYLNLDLSHLLGPDCYEAIADAPGERMHLLGEWLFGVAAFEEAGTEESYFDCFPELEEFWEGLNMSHDEVRKLRRETLPQWIEAVAAHPEWEAFDVIGFTSTFMQNVPSLALARRLKARRPRTVMVFGGGNFDGPAAKEYLRRFDFIDYAVSGEGEEAFPRLLSVLAGDSEGLEVPGVAFRDEEGEVSQGPPLPPAARMDDHPIPDYSDYFSRLSQLESVRVLGGRRVHLLAEFSRGCWWGHRHHCTFCGLNAAMMEYRAKSPPRAAEDLERLVARYGTFAVDAVDNILDMHYLSEFCATLKAKKWRADLFFEVKANLTREQIRKLAEVGVRKVQPGLESLSTDVLELMRKGSTVLLNVRLLKWAAYYGVRVAWNILWGFPGETDRHYWDQSRLIPLLAHLEPPGGVGRIWLERFSPYFSDPEIRLPGIEPSRAYHFAYPIPEIDYSAIAYYFEHEPIEGVSESAVSSLRAVVGEWQKGWRGGNRPSLTYRHGPGWVQVTDTRGGDTERRDYVGGRQKSWIYVGTIQEAPMESAMNSVQLAGMMSATRRYGGSCRPQ